MGDFAIGSANGASASAPPPPPETPRETAYRVIAETSQYGRYDLDGIRNAVGELRQVDPARAAAVERELMSLMTPVQQGEYLRGGNTASMPVAEPLSAANRDQVCHGPPAAPGSGFSQADLTRVAQANGAAAEQRTWDPLNLFWFRDQVRNGAPMDYKQQHPSLQDFGNYNYGYTGSAMHVAADFLQRQAGVAQQAAGTSRPEWGSPGLFGMFGGSAPYGDDPRDQTMMIQGMEDRRNGC